jgi:hypothetical protein
LPLIEVPPWLNGSRHCTRALAVWLNIHHTSLKKPFAEYYDMVYFDMAGFEGGQVALNCALQGIRPERLVFASDYPQDFTGVNTDTGKGMSELKSYIETIRNLQLDASQKQAILGATAAGLLKI